MGGNLGCHRSIPRDPSDLCHSRKFSAACNFSNILVNQERLNINTATEEELMTLPGVTRLVAQNIVEYREYIGGFKKVEDLALVSGIGAAKLEQVKFEICVSSKGNSAQHSPNSLRKDQNLDHLSAIKININTATPAQLMSIRGITEKIVNSIVEYRREHGPFKSIEDLLKMNCINSSFFDKIGHQIFAERSRPPSTNTNSGLNFTVKPHPSPTSLSLQSEDLDFPPGGPTQIISTRPTVEIFGGVRDGRPVLRVATWNLQSCSAEKANNPGVREVVCMTLLENSIKLLAVQELIDRDALEKFCMELNQPTLPNIRKWKGSRGCWKGSISEKLSGHPEKCVEYSGFLWDTTAGIELKEATFSEGPYTNGSGKQVHPHPYIAYFKIGMNDLILVNLHLVPLPSTGGNSVKNQNSHKLAVFAHIVQETLKEAEINMAKNQYRARRMWKKSPPQWKQEPFKPQTPSPKSLLCFKSGKAGHRTAECHSQALAKKPDQPLGEKPTKPGQHRKEMALRSREAVEPLGKKMWQFWVILASPPIVVTMTCYERKSSTIWFLQVHSQTSAQRILKVPNLWTISGSVVV
ncbi:endonuclease/exonuclease/phosphatase family domain-containing protein 1 isoform X1 [Thamnophis elegans]|uniref:endonuclease/exonuclease/phosphatase family domain-containing protein 1 isoform X1 n=1 Tax=Thamnophis elegans TaxID=35005 RepID=UPI001378AF2E|nr:endonuclease/exonuclease/phosphatase family domain-containing protein 1 isoform X1 [Thamnophis elegans]